MEKINILHDLLEKVVITPEIHREFGEVLPGWIEVLSVKNRSYLRFLTQSLDEGEASAIALAQEHMNSFLVLDDLKARKISEQLNIDFTGTLGVFLRAKKVNIIDSMKPILDGMEKLGFRLSPELREVILLMANER